MDHYGIFKIAGSDPELFVIAFANLSRLPKREFMTMTHPLAETEIRAELAKMGRDAAEINSLIWQARDNPR